jgi:hypothetical protein
VRQLPEANWIQQATFPRRAKGFLHFARLFPGEDRRFREKDSGNEAAANPDFGGMEFPRGRSPWTESVCRVGDQEIQGERRKH